MAKMSCGYRSVRHANEGMGWAELITEPNDLDSLLLWPDTLWTKDPCGNDTTNAFAWWTRMYGGTVDQTLYMDQVGRIDVFGPHGAGWDVKWDPIGSMWDDLLNDWTGDYFSFDGVFDDDVTTARTIGLDPNYDILPVWRTWVDLTVSGYDPAFADTTTNELRTSFKKWMVFNEPFLRGLFPWNAVRLFKNAKREIRKPRGPDRSTAPVYIGGVSGGQTYDPTNDHPGGDPYTARRKLTMTQLEHQWALFTYGAGEDTLLGQTDFLNEALGFHQPYRAAPESAFLDKFGYAGTLEACASMFSIGRFWGMDPVRVIIDESAIAVPDFADGEPVRNKAEVQANYVERSLLLLLSSGYLDAIHLSFQDKCEKEGGKPIVSDKPGIGFHGDGDHLKPGFVAATVVDTMIGTLAYEGSLDLGLYDPDNVDPLIDLKDIYCLRFREPDTADPITTTAIWSADRKFDIQYSREEDADSIFIPVANAEPFTLTYRDSSWVENDPIWVCDSTGWLPDRLGQIVTKTSPTPVENSDTQSYELKVALTGAPLYLRSTENRVVLPDDWADASTLAGLETIYLYDDSQIFRLEFHAEQDYGPNDKIAFVFPSNWWPPSLDPAEKGYVTVHPVSRSLQGEGALDVSVEGDSAIVTFAELPAGSQFALVYGDSRSESILLDMGPWSSGPVDLDFAKIENWMTWEAEFDYRTDVGYPPPAYLSQPRVGWGLSPELGDLLGESERRVSFFSEFSPSTSGIYRDFTAFALKDSIQGEPAIDTLSLHVEVEPNTNYLLQIYLNDPDSEFEECDPSALPSECDKCFDPGTGEVCLMPTDNQQVWVWRDGVKSLWLDSSTDRLFTFTTDGDDEEVQVVFYHSNTVPDSVTGMIDNLVFCYGLELRKSDVGGGPAPGATAHTATFPVAVYHGSSSTWTELPNSPTIEVKNNNNTHPF